MSRSPGTSSETGTGAATVLFTVEGGPKVGMGHVLRSLELARELVRRSPHAVRFSVAGAAPAVHRVREAGFPLHPADGVPPDVDAVVFDLPGPLAPRTAPLRRRRPDLWLAALDCFEIDNPDLDLIVNLFNQDPHGRRPAAPRLAYREGVEYGIVRAAFDPFVTRERRLPVRAASVLLSFGGSDPGGLTLRTLRALAGRRIDGLHLHVVLGPGFSAGDAVERAAAELAVAATVHRDPDRVEALIAESDLAVISGGTTILEAAAVGTPVLALAQTEQERRFFTWFAERGAAVQVGRDTPPEGIAAAVVSLVGDADSRAAMSRAGRRLVDGRGRHRIADLIAAGIASRMQTRAAS